MALSLGAAHAATGTGSVAITGPAGLRVAFTTVPSFLGLDSGTPNEYYRLGRVNVGNSWGYLAHVDIVCTPQVVLDLPAGLTVLAWDFAPGVVATITELVETAAMSSLQPWDRNRVAWSRTAFPNGGPTGSEQTSFTYTVPTGKILCLAHASAWLYLITAPTAITNAYASILRGTDYVLNANFRTLPVPPNVTDRLGAGALYLSAGEVLAAKYHFAMTGGTLSAGFAASGYLFDA